MSVNGKEIEKNAFINNPLFIFSILVFALVPQEVGQVVTPIMGDIMHAFPGTSPNIVSYIMSAPGLATLIFAALVCGRLSVSVSTKTLAMWGLCIYTIGGVAGALVANLVDHRMPLRARDRRRFYYPADAGADSSVL